MRGIDFYNIPTTLLSQIDSSIGGKTAINFAGIKNIVGAFYQPKKVLIAHLHNSGSHIESSTSEEADGFSKYLPTSIFQILASLLMSKVFFPVALLFVSASSTSSIVLFRLLGGK